MPADTTIDRPAVNGELSGELINRVHRVRLSSQLGAKGSGGGAGWLPWLLCALLAATWAGVGIRGYRQPATATSNVAGPAPASSNANASLNASASPAAPAAVGTIQLEVKGYLTPARQIAVSPIDVAGRVVELNVIEGKLFKKGDVLAKLEDINYKAQVDESQAGLAAAVKRLEGAKARYAGMMPESVRPIEVTQVEEEMKEAQAMQARAQDDVTRYEKLGATAADRELKQAQFDLQAAAAKSQRLRATLVILKEGPRMESKASSESEVRAAEADVKAAQARLAQVEWRMDNCIIRAPLDGTALSKKCELGSLVNPLAFTSSAGGSSSGSVCDIADLGDLEVDLEIPERDISKLKVGHVCRIKTDAYPDRTYSGVLDRIMPIANRSKSVVTVRVKVTLPKGEVPGTYLKPEMGAVVSFLAS